MLKPCLEPGCPKLSTGSRCHEHTRLRDRQRGTRQQRGYTAEHDTLRAQLVAALDPWQPCPRCHEPLGRVSARLDLMHNDDRTGWLGLGHRACNRATTNNDDDRFFRDG